ncbi:glyoxalase/bleomycin resistance/dioxygenase family protein [Kibdelosporangium aridum]|uniref:Glyoxalase/bleomycin resistance/dioxygenase family protein n=1 Tax=Kibdelosporangium aridum TaxID=2030 RepID=A0A428Z0F2_KIBAR|nr:VOC family protein [Kibdelosporangium aridum]RSM77673.1 glyoxalase/bleomycin resistance/dioxygenase family protein [Kibdelosporangium aridum]
MTLRVEIFSADPDASAAFYHRVLGFHVEKRTETSKIYVSIRRGDVVIGIGQHFQDVPSSVRAVPAGAELVLEVDDVHAEFASVEASGWPVESGLSRQEWGLEDFRLFDPDGYYLRITSRQPG